MVQKKADATWEGTVQDGGGTVSLGSGAFEGPYTFASRMEGSSETNPDELIGAGLATCFNMALTAGLNEAGYGVDELNTEATVTLKQNGEDFLIPEIRLKLNATIPEIDEETFHQITEGAKANCPVSKALAGPEITLDATLN